MGGATEATSGVLTEGAESVRFSPVPRMGRRQGMDAMNRMNSGMTLVEALIVLSIAAILAATAIPATARWIDRYRLESGLQAMTRSLTLARTEAVIRVGRVSLSNATNQWENGWQLFHDRNRNGVLDSADELIHEQGQLSNVRIRGNLSVSTLVTYRADGRSVLPSGAFQAGTFLLCPSHSALTGYKLIIAKGGRARIERLAVNASECK